MLLGMLHLSFPLSVMAISRGAGHFLSISFGVKTNWPASLLCCLQFFVVEFSLQSHRYRKLSDQPPIFLCCLTCTLGGGSQCVVSDINVGDWLIGGLYLSCTWLQEVQCRNCTQCLYSEEEGNSGACCTFKCFSYKWECSSSKPGGWVMCWITLYLRTWKIIYFFFVWWPSLFCAAAGRGNCLS